jgi:hypothetical protein
MRRCWIFFALAVGLVGCGGKTKAPELTEAEGVVTVNGQPLPNAQVTFTPTASGVSGQAIARGVSDDQGRYRLTCDGQPGAVVGENVVTITEGPTPDDVRGEDGQAKYKEFAAKLKNRPIPAIYANVAKSPLRVTVKAGQKDYPLVLQR